MLCDTMVSISARSWFKTPGSFGLKRKVAVFLTLHPDRYSVVGAIIEIVIHNLSAFEC